ncbi:MAG: hypothetical protein HC849_16450 [Oscillatoriales cyanobacterium RU_3_3]|nr:hypothetical protein [Oscillatoriales cyanobacterium RU_3_3]
MNGKFFDSSKHGNSCSQRILLQDLETCMELSESEQELIKGGQTNNPPSSRTVFWGVRTTGGLWTFWWDRATRKFGFSYQFT